MKALSYFLTISIFVVTGLVTGTVSSFALSQEATISLPRVVIQEMPSAPQARFGPAPEGWIKVRYSVLADGSTGNIEILDIMPPRLTTRATLKAIQDWTFTPASLNGEAIDWHNNIEVIQFDHETVANISGPAFTGPYEEVEELVNDQNYSRAQSRSTRLIRESLFTLHDIGLANFQLATIEMRLQNPTAAYLAITRATEPAVNQLSTEELSVVLRYKFAIELSLSRLTDALKTYNRLLGLSPIADDDPIHAQADTIQTGLTDYYTQGVGIPGTINDEGWFHILSTRTFTLADIEGEIENINMTCNQRLTTFRYQSDIEWLLPENWGDCSLIVVGKRNTQFTFYEFL